MKKKVCICGKLDPMAEGDLLLLFDDECKLMNQHLHYNKTYVFSILWGFKTTSDDTLGFIIDMKKTKSEHIKYEYIKHLLNDFTGTYKQYFHKYSAKPVFNKNGEKHSLWHWSNLNRLNEIDIPEKQVNVDYIHHLYTEKKNFSVIQSEIIEYLEKLEDKNNTFSK